MSRHIFTVSQVNRYMKRLMEDDALLAGLFIEGELSNVNHHGSGHVYFTLKDETAAVSGVLFKSHAGELAFSPENGMKILVFGRFSLYEKTGQYQLYAEYIEPAGIGSLQKAFEQLRTQLNKEGLFDPANKKNIPAFVSCVAVITSPTGAAVRDIIKTIRQRNKAIKIVIVPALVQGADAAAAITCAIEDVNKWNQADVIILARGGGSMEDLWAFNEEATVRAVAKSVIPIISAIGHETDFTITDFAADYRAATPTAAANLLYDGADTLSYVRHLFERLNKIVPEAVYDRQLHLHSLLKNMNRNAQSVIHKNQAVLAKTTASLEKNSPYVWWKQGMAMVRGASGEPVTSAAGLSTGMRLTLSWQDGDVGVEII